jgi:hypothetical protein
MSTLVKKTDDISSISNGEFVFCKELNKGFIKRDISSLDTVTFEGVSQAIEALDLNVLNTLGLDSVQFGGNYDDLRGEIKISDKRNKLINMSVTENINLCKPQDFMNSLISNESTKSRYFKSGELDVSKMNFDTLNIPQMDKFNMYGENSNYVVIEVPNDATETYDYYVKQAQDRADALFAEDDTKIPLVMIVDKKTGKSPAM